MDKAKVLELLKKASADCDRSVEKGFGPDLNVLTIKKQIDDAAGLLGTAGDEKSGAAPVHEVQNKGGEESVTPESPEGGTVEKKDERTEAGGTSGDLAGQIGELSKEVTLKKEPAPQEGIKPEEQPKKLDSSGQEPAQPFKQSSSVTEKTDKA